MTKRYQTSWSGQRHIIRVANRWMDQPTWARTMVYFAIGYFIGSNWDAWLS